MRMKRLICAMALTLMMALVLAVPAMAEGPAPASVITVLDLDPDTASNPKGTWHTVTATYTENDRPVEDIKIGFAVTGANAGAEANGHGFDQNGASIVGPYSYTDANGIATWSYFGENTGVDTITGSEPGCAPDSVTKNWTQESIPSMTQWGIIGLMAALALAAVLMLRKRPANAS